MADDVNDALSSLLPGGRGVWIPMDHGLSSYPVEGLNDIDSAVDDCISAGADAIVLQKGVLSYQLSRTKWKNFVMHVSASTIHGGKMRIERCLLELQRRPTIEVQVLFHVK